MNISDLFENSDFTNYGSLSNGNRRGSKGPHITKQGRLFGVTEEFDDYLSVRYGKVDGKKIIAISKSNADDRDAIKSSTVSTRIPFLNISKLCIEWFGNNINDWEKELRLVEKNGGVSYYEVVEEWN